MKKSPKHKPIASLNRDPTVQATYLLTYLLHGAGSFLSS